MHAASRMLALFCAFATLSSDAWIGTLAQGQSTPGQPPAADWHFRYDLFQMLLEEHGLRVLSRIDQALEAPHDSVIVINGSPPSQFSAADWASLVQFVAGGGSLLLASDSSFIGPGFGRFAKGPVTSSDANTQYQGFADCLQITAINDVNQRFSGIDYVVTNRSGWFVANPMGSLHWEPIAVLPQNCRPVAAQGQTLLALGRSSASATGLAIVSADASLFSNGMLWHGNAIAAIRVSEALCENHKTQLLFLYDGLPLESYRSRFPPAPSEKDVALDRELPEPELSKALRLVNAVAHEIAESNVLNEALMQRPRNWQPERYFRALMMVAAVLVLLGFVGIILSSGKMKPAILPARRMQSALEMRGTLGNQADIRSSAGYLAREFCFELTDSRNSTDWRLYLASLIARPLPPDRTEQQSLSKIIDIACRGQQAKMSSLELQALGQSISTLREKYRKMARKV